MKARIAYYFIGLVIAAVAVAAVVSLSSYATKTNASLMATQAELQALQKEYDQLKGDHVALSKEYDQAKVELQAANDKVAALEGELETAKTQNEQLGQTIKVAQLNMNVLNGLFDDSIGLEEMETRIQATGNPDLNSKWNAVNSQESLGGFIVYLVHTVWESLN